jgi:DNA repair exonuclease SbcCD nuclease subunit
MTPIRFIHTSDIHLDTSFSGAGLPSRLGDRKREAIRGTFRRILEDARRQSVDLVLIAGDLFEHDRVTPDTVEFLKQQFENLDGIRVFIAPGNHDPCLRESPYCTEAWPENVHIFREEEFRSVEMADTGVRVTGFGFAHSRLEEPIFQKLPVLPAEGWNLVLAHGSDVGCVPAGKAAHGPFTVGEISGKNVHYCALGHYHRQRPVLNPLDSARIWYCGIPEGRAWDEEGACGYLLGEIDGSGGIEVKSCPASQYPLATITVDCDGYTSREQIVDDILRRRGGAFDENTIVRVRLEGSLDPRLYLSTSEMEERLAGAALFLAWENHTVPAIDFAALANERTLCGYYVRSVNHQIAAAPAAERPVLERARLYGVQALLGREVRAR